MNFLGSNEIKITKDNSEHKPHLEITEVMLVHYDIVNNDCQQDSTVLYTLVPNKSCAQLLKITNKFCFQSFNSEFLYIEVWFRDQSSKGLEIENNKSNISH